jgi:hypothetical protein
LDSGATSRKAAISGVSPWERAEAVFELKCTGLDVMDFQRKKNAFNGSKRGILYVPDGNPG